jgi:hypothetical protein
MHRKHRARTTLRRLRLATAVGLVAFVGALWLSTTGTTLARVTATRTGGINSLAAGTVTLADSAIASCPVTGLLPHNTASTCTFTATYAGPAAAYLAVDVLIETQAGTGGTKLYNPADSANDLQITISSTSPTVSYTVPTTSTSCPGGAPSGSTCYELDDELVATTSFTSAAVAFSAAVKIPVSSPTGYQGGAAQIIMTTHAVQSQNNTLACSTTPTAGSACTPSGSFAWT